MGASGGKPAFERNDEAWWIWWDNITENWLISETFLDIIPCWRRHDDNIIGEYQPESGAVGVATVS